MKGRFFLAGLVLLGLFTAAVYYTQPPEEEPLAHPKSVDLVVVGRGIPALTAALEASQQGAEILLVDNRALADEFPYPLGGRFVSPHQEPGEGVGEAKEDALTQEEGRQALYERIRSASPGIQEEMLKVVLAQGQETLDWLTRETGLSFYTEEDLYHTYGDLFRNPSMLEDVLYQQVLSQITESVPGGQPLALHVNSQGALEGVTIQKPGGDEVLVMAQAVILAPGGYTHNRNVMEEYNSNLAAYRSDSRSSGTGGEAFQLLKPHGVEMNYPSRVYLALILQPAGMIITPANEALLQEALWLTETGEDITVLAQAALEDGGEALKSFLKDTAGGRVVLLFSSEESIGAGQSHIYVGSFQELTEQTGLSLEQATNISQALPPPYYLQNLHVEVYYTMGGIPVDVWGRALQGSRVFPGVYVLGEAAGSLHGAGIYPGLPLTEALVMGRRVGREAASYARR